MELSFELYLVLTSSDFKVFWIGLNYNKNYFLAFCATNLKGLNTK